MSMRGSCSCQNISVEWKTIDFGVVPRQCQCEYCTAKHASYISKSGTSFKLRVKNESLHVVVRHGSGSADFHECKNCGDVVCVTAEIDGEIYGALNSQCMENKLGFTSAVEFDASGQSASEKLERWRQNWCHPVLITSPGCKAQAGATAASA